MTDDVAQENNLEARFDAADVVDTTELHQELLAVRDEYFALIESNFPMRRVKADDLESFVGLENAEQQFGCVRIYTGQGVEGSPIDLCIVAWIANPTKGFSNIHLTIYCDENSEAPNLGFALGTVPDVFFYVDLPPRKDVQVHFDHLDYMEPLNKVALATMGDKDISWFHSRSPHVRATISPIGLCAITNTDVFREKVKPILKQYIDHWIACVKKAPPSADPETQKIRDVKWRQTVVDNDPMNVMADRFVGEAMRDRLLLALRGDIR